VNFAKPVNWARETVQYPPQHFLANRDALVIAGQHDPVAPAHAGQRRHRHHQRLLACKTHDTRVDAASPARNPATGTYRGRKVRHAHRKPSDGVHAAGYSDRVEVAQDVPV